MPCQKKLAQISAMATAMTESKAVETKYDLQTSNGAWTEWYLSSEGQSWLAKNPKVDNTFEVYFAGWYAAMKAVQTMTAVNKEAKVGK